MCNSDMWLVSSAEVCFVLVGKLNLQVECSDFDFDIVVCLVLLLLL